MKRKAPPDQGDAAPKPKKPGGMKLTFRRSAPIEPKKERADGDNAAAAAAAGCASAAGKPTPRAVYEEEPEMEWAPGGADVTKDFTEGQLRRYEKFRRSTFHRSKLKQLVAEASGGKSCNDRVAVTIQAIAKVLVGELVGKGREVMFAWGETGALTTQHVQEATRLLKMEGVIPPPRPPRLFE